MLCKNDITNLYLQYGFEAGEVNEDYLVFFMQSGYFQNAEIVILNKATQECDIDISGYECLGYSVRLRRFDNIIAIHNALFNGFFNTTMSNKKLLSEYESFCEQQKHKLPHNKYEYIRGEFVENGVPQSANVLERILDVFKSDERQLIILEASAGYGKTCTSFEVIRELVEKIPDKIPLLTELSKNRKASVFRYVLLSEIDQKFPALSSELVTNEIKNGRILLIIDGFDELLSKNNSTSSLDNEKNLGKDAQTMLDTIAQLITTESKTKILLTTRNSSIFVGKEFDEWVDQHLVDCNITRLQLSEPSLRDWIGAEKIEILKANKIDLNNVLNPVLLTLLKNEPLDGFETKYTSNEEIVKQYLDLLLRREQQRQALPLSVEEQLRIMRDLAVQMVQLDISAEDIDFIKLILADVTSRDINTYLERYDALPDSAENKPSEAEFINKLSHHALLDRISTQNNLIGFINEFIFGLMMAKAVLEFQLSPTELQGKYLDVAITAYSTYNATQRKLLYKTIEPVLSKETPQRRIFASMYLCDEIKGSYPDQYFDGIFFENNIVISADACFTNCIFSDCIFDHCILNTDAFHTCQFYNCTFYDCSVELGDILNCELMFLHCTGHEKFAQCAYRCEPVADSTIDYERVVLEQFWKPGYEKAEPRRSYLALLKGVPSSDKQALVNAIDSLVKKNLLKRWQRVYVLNFEKIEVIKKIIGR